jgi:glycosyltransferase involved in cell wall biosynthesis
LTPTWPRGKAFGGQLRALHIGRALKQMGDVKLLVVSSDQQDPEAVRQTAEEFEFEDAAQVEVCHNHGLVEKLRWGFDSKFLNIHGCVASPQDRARVDSLIREFDLVWLMNSRTPNIMMRWLWPHSHLDIDDVQSTYLKTLAQNAPQLLARTSAHARSLVMQRRELLYRTRFTTQSVCSESDRAYLGGGNAIHVISNGYARPKIEPRRIAPVNPPRIGFIGLYSYGPNREGVEWFLKECWPLIRTSTPGIRFRVVGQGTADLREKNWPDTDALGWLDDPAPEISTWSAMIVPIRVGGGTRIKIADAFSRKCPVVATQIGAFGYDLENGRHLLIADAARDFAAACVQLVKNQNEGIAIAERAWKVFLERWTWDAVTPKVWAAAEDCLQRAKAGL